MVEKIKKQCDDLRKYLPLYLKIQASCYDMIET